jgi:carbonic anhydrase
MTEAAIAPLIAAARAWCAGLPAPAATAAPPVLLVAAPDLPADIGVLTGAAPGSLYTLTAPGALAPPSAESAPDSADAAFAAGLEFAFRVFGARDVVIVAHTGCALVRALTAEAEKSLMAFGHAPALARLAGLAAPAVARSAGAETDPAAQRRLAAMELVRLSVEHLMSHATLLDGVLGRHVALHGWLLDRDAGTLWTLDPAEDVFRKA